MMMMIAWMMTPTTLWMHCMMHVYIACRNVKDTFYMAGNMPIGFLVNF